MKGLSESDGNACVKEITAVLGVAGGGASNDEDEGAGGSAGARTARRRIPRGRRRRRLARQPTDRPTACLERCARMARC